MIPKSQNGDARMDSNSASTDLTTPTPASQPGAHHLTLENVAAVIKDLREIADGTTERSIYSRDWVAYSGVLALIIEWLAGKAQESAPSSVEIATWAERYEALSKKLNVPPNDLRAERRKSACRDAEIADLRAALARCATAGTPAAPSSDLVQAARALEHFKHTEAPADFNASIKDMHYIWMAAWQACRATAGTTAQVFRSEDGREITKVGDEYSGDSVVNGLFRRVAGTTAAPSSLTVYARQIDIDNLNRDRAILVYRDAGEEWTVPFVLAGNAAPTDEATREFDAARLRRLVRAVGLEKSVPTSDIVLLGCIGTVLGMIAGKVEKMVASNTATTAPDNFGQEVTRLVNAIRKPCSLAWRDSLVEELIELIDPTPEGVERAATAAPGDLPPLPEPETLGSTRHGSLIKGHTDDAMREYGRACIASNAGSAPAEARPKVCEHANSSASWSYVQCQDCGSILTDNDWGIASRMWFKSEDEAKFYKSHGRLPAAPPNSPA